MAILRTQSPEEAIQIIRHERKLKLGVAIAGLVAVILAILIALELQFTNSRIPGESVQESPSLNGSQ